MNEKELLIKEITDKLGSKISESVKGFMTEADIEKVKKEFSESIEKMNDKQIAEFKETIEKLENNENATKEAFAKIENIVKEQSKEIESLKISTVKTAETANLTQSEKIKLAVVKAVLSDEFKAFKEVDFKGASHVIKLTKDNIDKATIGVDIDHTGDVLGAEVSTIIRDDNPIRKAHVRDALTVRATKANSIVAGQLYSETDILTLGALILAENAQSPESAFKTKEVIFKTKRISNSFTISKRYMKENSLSWLVNHLIAKIPDAMLNVEDFQLLFGDGLGDNVEGLAKLAQIMNLENYVTYVAGDFSSVASWDGGATQSLVTFANGHGIANGDSLTIANSTNYDGIYTGVEVVNATQVIIDKAYVAEATATWTGSVNSVFFHSVDDAQEYDILNVVRALLSAGEYGVTAHIVNPQQKIQMGLLKDTTANYLNIQKDANGDVVGVGGVPLIATTAMPVGRSMSGDFSSMAVELAEVTPVTIQFSEDSTDLKKNQVSVIVSLEVIFAVYNPYHFMQAKFSDVKTQLETP